MNLRVSYPCADYEDGRDFRHVTPSYTRLPRFGLRQSRLLQSINNESRVKARLKQAMKRPVKIQLRLWLSHYPFRLFCEWRQIRTYFDARAHCVASGVLFIHFGKPMDRRSVKAGMRHRKDKC